MRQGGICFALAGGQLVSTAGFLGGRAECWHLFYSYGSCCDSAIWGKSGNPQCFAGQSPQDSKWQRDYCCSSDPEALPCNEHLLGMQDVSAYRLGRAVEILTCFCRSLGPRAVKTQAWLEKANSLATSLEEGGSKRALHLVAIEWQRMSNESYMSPVAQLTPHVSLSSRMSPFGVQLRTCAKARRHFPRPVRFWSPWGFDGTTRVGRTIWCLCMSEDVSHVLDLFALFGSGSALTAAHALHRKGRGSVTTIERDSEYASKARLNLQGYPNARVVEGDAFVELPRLCPILKSSASLAQQRNFDVVIVDPFDDGISWRELIIVVKPCRPRFWVINNVQWSDVSEVVSNMLANGHNLVLHDFSPTLVANKFHLEEFVVLNSD